MHGREADNERRKARRQKWARLTRSRDLCLASTRHPPHHVARPPRGLVGHGRHRLRAGLTLVLRKAAVRCWSAPPRQPRWQRRSFEYGGRRRRGSRRRRWRRRRRRASRAGVEPDARPAPTVRERHRPAVLDLGGLLAGGWGLTIVFTCSKSFWLHVHNQSCLNFTIKLFHELHNDLVTW
jgi:hypothetical protein